MTLYGAPFADPLRPWETDLGRGPRRPRDPEVGLMERFVGPDAGETRAPFPELTPKRRERLLTLIARSLHPYVCGSDLPGIPECAQRARAVVEEWEADEVSR